MGGIYWEEINCLIDKILNISDVVSRNSKTLIDFARRTFFLIKKTKITNYCIHIFDNRSFRRNIAEIHIQPKI